jgi:hypothetical protein
MPTGSFFIVNLTLKHEPITGTGTPHFFYYTTKYKPFCQKNRKTDQTGTESVNPATKQQAQSSTKNGPTRPANTPSQQRPPFFSQQSRTGGVSPA